MISLTILGCGNSTGVPIIHCDCRVCRSRDRKNRRTRTSVWMEVDGKSFLIDTSPDLRAQAIREKLGPVDAVLFTHPHADHTAGIDDLRSFHYFQGRKPIPTYANDWTLRELRSRFAYMLPLLSLHPISQEPFVVSGVQVLPLPVGHVNEINFGFRIKNVAYLTDISDLPESTKARLEGLDLLVLDCIQLKPHHSHFHLERALEVIQELRPRRSVLTHLSHSIDYKRVSKTLPPSVSLAYDGMKIRVK